VSKSLKRVEAEAKALGLSIEIIREDVVTTTAQLAADARGCGVNQIVKSILFREDGSERHVLFLTAGGNRVSHTKAEAACGHALVRADAASIRAYTGFAIGGVSPLGHLNPVLKYMDPSLMDYPTIWAAAGTPNHVFEIAPALLAEKSGAHVIDFTE